MIKAVIFDMDGLLVDSEPLWEEAEVAVFNQVGVPLTRGMTKQTMGLRADEVVRYWHNRYPWDTPSQKAVEDKLVDMVVELMHERDMALPGVHEVMTLCKRLGLPMAIASSSSRRIISAATDRLRIASDLQVIHSAEREPYGKPHPGVFLSAADKLGVQPEYCLVFEDSANGVLAAKAARMKCIAVPSGKLGSNPVFGIADRTLASLKEVTSSLLQAF